MKDLGNGFYIVNNEDELKKIERMAGYRGHDDPHLDALIGDQLKSYPAIVTCRFEYENYDCISHYHTTAFTVDMAWNLIIAQTEMKVGDK